MVEALPVLTLGQSIGLAACVATVAVLVLGWWTLGT
jgi:hypothetical protein